MALHSSDPVRCAEAIVDRVGREIVLAIPIGIGKPMLLVNALYRLAELDRRLRLHIFTGLTLVRPRYRTLLEQRFLAPLLDRLFGSYPRCDYAEALHESRLPPNIQVTEFFLQAGAWLSNARVQQSYTNLNYSQVARHLERAGANVFAQLVSPRSDGEFVSLSSNTDVTLDMRSYVAGLRRTGRPVVLAGEINANLPYMAGEAEIERGEFDVLLEPNAPHYDLFAPPKEPVSLVDYAMALHAATLIKDGGTLQIGIGSFSDALVHALILRHVRNREFRVLVECLGPLHVEAQLTPFSRGLYGCTEMLVDGFLALMRAGILCRRVSDRDGREAVLHAGFFVGSKAFYDELRQMPRAARDLIAMTSISFTNTLEGDAALKREQRRDARFVNTAMTATLLGTASSDQLEDGRVVSGAGGQHDLVHIAQVLEGGRSIIAVRSTRRAGRRTVSNIVWQYANSTVPRHLRDIFITEYGIADVRGKSDRDVIVAMLGVADGEMQKTLQRQAQAAGKLETSFNLAPSRTQNNVRSLEKALGPARRKGLLPIFPLGTEMSDVEQTLIGPLALLRNASYTELVGVAIAGLIRGAPEKSEIPALERLSLASPSTFLDHAMRVLVLGALRHRPSSPQQKAVPE